MSADSGGHSTAVCQLIQVVIDVVLTRQRCVFSNTDSIAAQCPNVGVLQHSVPTWVYCSTVSQRGCIAAQCPHALCEYFITIVSKFAQTTSQE